MLYGYLNHATSNESHPADRSNSVIARFSAKDAEKCKLDNELPCTFCTFTYCAIVFSRILTPDKYQNCTRGTKFFVFRSAPADK